MDDKVTLRSKDGSDVEATVGCFRFIRPWWELAPKSPRSRHLGVGGRNLAYIGY